MIKKSLITAAILLIIYHCSLPHLSRDYYWIAGQQRANYLRAQQYIHDAPSDANVIVGSSMANMLNPQILGPSYRKLTFPAGGSITGLEMIRATGKRPKLLWVETNTALKDAEQTLLDDVLSPWRLKLRSTSSVFKEEGRPSNYTVGFFNAWIGRAGRGFNKLVHNESFAADTPNADSSIFADVMKANHEYLDREPPLAILTDKVARIGVLVDEIARQGTTCILFEMPIDSSLQCLLEPEAVRRAMEKRFPRESYHWFPSNRSHAYQTSDGIHLSKFEADTLTREMLDASKSMEN
jgi:hypothetical protein